MARLSKIEHTQGQVHDFESLTLTVFEANLAITCDSCISVRIRIVELVDTSITIIIRNGSNHERLITMWIISVICLLKVCVHK